MMYDVNKLNLDSLKGYDFSARGAEMPLAKAPVFIRDGELYLDCETNVFVADYYNESGIEILEEVRDWAKANGGFWEWVNPGCLMFCK